MAEAKDDTWKDSAREKEKEFGVELSNTSKEEVVVITQSSPKEETVIPPVGGKSKEQERLGLTNAEAEEGYKTWGFNELPTIEIPLWWVFLKQFTGTMPYMMEVCIIVAGATQDWPDFGIIIGMVCIFRIFIYNNNSNIMYE